MPFRESFFRSIVRKDFIDTVRTEFYKKKILLLLCPFINGLQNRNGQ